MGSRCRGSRGAERSSQSIGAVVNDVAGSRGVFLEASDVAGRASTSGIVPFALKAGLIVFAVPCIALYHAAQESSHSRFLSNSSSSGCCTAHRLSHLFMSAVVLVITRAAVAAETTSKTPIGCRPQWCVACTWSPRAQVSSRHSLEQEMDR